ncbi:MAG: CDP-alcohol phosphatidyltransferase family protein [Rhodothermaceae bacterium]|nr:CDP-alcohol phosphatidyltransferase family protein [Rhodothermaceae bacterium]MXZ56985.1 CDP-alcohol phosphatidyltransferase family protein [Rhodothermaceae bacterium]MYB90720.1 CDP-alcohol phosphatidyltransferase family protein [Rhodothermaceae bacterium]MYD68723.1 CDP-alcohol phosphatidyltransferase family protein [Rhodothermaceae bacterium]MYG45312.1 CDP-alcohol phosphatidyltransferase family protein [Rhodothermaceae bacterium]
MRFIPNAITVFRILVTPFLIFCLFQKTLSFASLAFTLFILGAVSDFADGYVARALKNQSRLGRHLDPIADKIFVLGGFVALAWLHPQQVPWWAVGLIVIRDALVTGLRMTAESAGGSLPTIRFAKAKTALQMTYLGLFLLTLTLQYLPETQALAEAFLKGNVMYGFMIMVVVVTCLSALSYIRIYLKNVTIANE